jgi:8-oxo-dGTP pyrophosphatase MutT (NUDIX family)
MPLPKPWTTISSRMALDDRWLKVRADRCQTAEGRIIDPYFVIEAPDFVHIAAITADEQMVMVRQYRQGSGTIHLELPAGLVDAGDKDTIEAAQRELREETGFVAESWERIAHWWANPARQDTRHHLLLAKGARRVGEQILDEAESLVMELIPMAELPARIRSGEIDGSQHVAAVLRILMDWTPRSGSPTLSQKGTSAGS